MSYTCNICKKEFSSCSTMRVHKREKHTFYNTIDKICTSCNKSFKSVIFNKKKDKYYSTCEECRALQKKLNTNALINGTYVYGNKMDRYYIDNGNAIRVCSIYTCNKKFPCIEHHNNTLSECKHIKCNNCYISNNVTKCEKCITNSHVSKNKIRSKLKNFKIELGGKCVECGFDDLFFLEFDHIDPSKKIKQITRSSPNDWVKEKDNLQLLCGRCHRIKSSSNHALNRNIVYRNAQNDKKNIVRNIKKTIGECQLCNWTINDKDKMCSALDFDHIDNYLKLDQISCLYNFKKETLYTEITKTRLICRHCHELRTCIQRGGKSLKFYYSDETIKKFEKHLNDTQLQLKCQNDIIKIIFNLL